MSYRLLGIVLSFEQLKRCNFQFKSNRKTEVTISVELMEDQSDMADIT